MSSFKQKIRNRATKQKLVGAKGGKCIRCGYNECLAALTFHHVDPSTKSFAISKYSSYSTEEVEAELKKCVLLCENCHRGVHAEVYSLDTHLCKDINVPFSLREMSLDISKETLYALLKQTSVRAVAAEFSVSESFIRKRAKELGITKIRKLDSLDKAYLESMLENKTLVKLANLLGVKESSLRKKIDCLGIVLKKELKCAKLFALSKEELQKLIWEVPMAKLANYYDCAGSTVKNRALFLGIKEYPAKGFWSRKC